MKTQLAVIALVLTFALPGFAKGPETCKVVTNDIGTITGRGPSSEKAFEDAATQCFDKHAALFQAKHKVRPDEDTGLLYIDICANVRCS